MSPRSYLRPCFHLLSLALLAMALLSVTAPRPAPAADLAKLDSAITEIPADAAFFGTMLRNREQIEIIAKSKAWAKLTALPFFKQGLDAFNAPGGPGDQFRDWYREAENKKLLDFVLDLLSHEVFVYGGAAWPGTSTLLGEVYTAVNVETTAMQLAGKLNDEERMAHAALRALQKRLDRLQVPDMIVGFKVSDVERAKGQMKKLEELIQDKARQVDELKGRLKKVQVAGGDFLTINLDGKMVPWDSIPPFSVVDKPEQYKDVLKKLQELKITVSLGVRGKYVVLAIGTSTDLLANLGKGKRLIDQPELKPLEKYADQRLVSISYSSKGMNEAVERSGTSAIDSYMDMAEKFLPKAKLTAEQQAKIKKDLADLSKEIKSEMPKAGASVSFGYITSKGYEGYTHDWSEYPYLDGSKPLSILENVGGSPLGFFAVRSKQKSDWPQMVKWIKKVYSYAEEYAVPQMPDEQRQKFTKFMKAATPLFQRFDEATGKLLVPALADGQYGFVLDAKLTSRQWHQFVPKSDKPLPMLEPAVLVGVSDSAKLEKAFAEYRAIFNGLIAEARKIDENTPDFQIPAPEVRKLANGTAYVYPLPEALGFDKKLTPGAAVSSKMAALTLSSEQSDRLLTATPLKITSGPLADTKKPLANAAYWNWAGFFDFVGTWVEFGVGTVLAVKAEHPVAAVANAQQDDPLKQVRTVFEVLKCLRSYSSATYQQSGVWITHRETLIRDLE
jgi:hypothetical protein